MSGTTPKRAEGYLISRFGPYIGKRVLEVGAAEEEWSRRCRRVCEGSDYVGTDMRHAKTVDIVHNLNDPLDVPPFDFVICLSVMEHCDRPWLVAENLTRVMKPGARLILSAPFAWRVHGYPNDYFRYTFNGIKTLYPEIHWDFEACWPGTESVERHPKGQTMLLMSGLRLGVTA